MCWQSEHGDGSLGCRNVSQNELMIKTVEWFDYGSPGQCDRFQRVSIIKLSRMCIVTSFDWIFLGSQLTVSLSYGARQLTVVNTSSSPFLSESPILGWWSEREYLFIKWLTFVASIRPGSWRKCDSRTCRYGRENSAARMEQCMCVAKNHSSSGSIQSRENVSRLFS